MDSELKARDMDEVQKIILFNAIQQSDGFCGIGILFDKQHMHKPIEDENMFYNYGVKVLFDNVIFPLVDESDNEFVFHVLCDNRSMKSSDSKDLEKYLATSFIEKNCSFEVKYGNSARDYCIQIADLIVNTVFMMATDRSVVENVLKTWNKNQFSIIRLPESEHVGRTNKFF